MIQGKCAFFMESHDAAATYLLKLWPQIEANKNKIIAGTGVFLAIIAIVLIFSWRREANRVDAGDALTQTLITVPPNADPSQLAQSYLAVANDYAGTAAGTRALLQGAAVLFGQGKYTEARSHFQRYLDEHPDDDLSAIAALGVARCLDAEGKINDAVGAYQHVAQDFADAQSVSQARYSLARINIQQGKYTDAMQGLQQVIQSDPYGALGNEARQIAVELQSKLPRQAPAPQASPFNLSH
jgi:TolA-binding protein